MALADENVPMKENSSLLSNNASRSMGANFESWAKEKRAVDIDIDSVASPMKKSRSSLGLSSQSTPSEFVATQAHLSKKQLPHRTPRPRNSNQVRKEGCELRNAIRYVCAMPMHAIRTSCQKRSLPVKGSKKQLLKRLIRFLLQGDRKGQIANKYTNDHAKKAETECASLNEKNGNKENEDAVMEMADAAMDHVKATGASLPPGGVGYAEDVVADEDTPTQLRRESVTDTAHFLSLDARAQGVSASIMTRTPDYGSWSVPELRAACLAQGLPDEGLQACLIARLLAAHSISLSESADQSPKEETCNADEFALVAEFMIFMSSSGCDLVCRKSQGNSPGSKEKVTPPPRAVIDAASRTKAAAQDAHAPKSLIRSKKTRGASVTEIDIQAVEEEPRLKRLKKLKNF